MSEKEVNFSVIMKELVEIAISDGKISTEEENFLKRLQVDVDKYQRSVELAKQDQMISDDEFHDLVILRDKILIDAEDFETDSENINNMVQKLWNEVNRHIIPGMESDEYTDEEK